MSSSAVAPVRIIVFCAATAAFLYQFENCLMTTALPVMAHQIPGLRAVVALVPAAYLVAATMAIVPAGRLAMRIGFNRVLAMALGLLAVGSIVCAVSQNVPLLCTGRVLQGLGGGSMASAGYGMISIFLSDAERRSALGWVSAGAGLGMIVGTPLGGLVAAVVSWRAIFAGLVPVFLIGAWAVYGRPLGECRTSERHPLAVGRSGLLALAAGGLAVAGALGNDLGWGNPGIVLALGGSILVLFVFLVSERTSRHPLFGSRIWGAKSFWLGWLVLFVSLAAMAGAFFAIPFYLHVDVGLSVPVAARWMVIQVVAYSLAASLAVRTRRMLSAEFQAVVGLATAMLGSAVFGFGFVREGGAGEIALGCALLGAGFGWAVPAVNARCISFLSESQRGAASSLLPLGINLGSATGVVLCGELREFHAIGDASAMFGVLAATVLAIGGILGSHLIRKSA